MDSTGASAAATNQPSEPTFGEGKICYIMLPAADIATSARFYGQVFGWNIRQSSDGHTSFDDGVGEVSGMWVTGKPPADENGLRIYIMVMDAKATVEKVLAGGGAILQPIGFEAPEISALFSDPYGNVMGIYQHGR